MTRATERRTYHRFRAALAAAELPAGPTAPVEIVTDEHLAALPDPAQHYLQFMGIVGRPRDWSFQTRLTGRFRLRPGQRWMPFNAWQYNTSLDVARIFHMRLRLAGVVPMYARDTYQHGRGNMHGTVAGLVTVADGQGPEFDIGELVTYLNDAILLAPGMLLSPAVTWKEVDDRSFDVTLRDASHEVTGRVAINQCGAPTDFSTTDRYCALPSGLVRALWSTPIKGWTKVDGRPFPTGGWAVWHLDDGLFIYADADFVPAALAYNVPPPIRSERDLVSREAQPRSTHATGQARP